MKRTRKIALGATAALVLGLAVAAVYAQSGISGGTGPMGGTGPGAGSGHGMMGAHAGGNRADMIDGRLTSLKTELKLTAAQESAWQKFADAARQQGEGAKAMHEAMQSGTQSAPERMAQRMEFMQQRLAGMQTTSSALTELYAVLTPEQKAIANQGLGPMAGRHMARLKHRN